MSPKRIESRFITPEGIKIIEIKERDKSFTVGPSEAIRILGIARTTLFRHDGPDVQRIPLNRGPNAPKDERVYDDNALLRIATETRNIILKSNEAGLTELTSPTTTTVLDIDFNEAIVIYSRLPQESK